MSSEQYRHLERDIGFSGVTHRFSYAEIEGEAGGLELVTRMASWYDGAYAYQLYEDAVRMLDSALSSQEVTALWLAGTFRKFDLEMWGIDAREWLRHIADISLARIHLGDPSFPSLVPEAVADKDLRVLVLADLRAVAPALETATGQHHYAAVQGVVPALERVITEVELDLGYRLFLRAVKGFFTPISNARYDRFMEVGAMLGLDQDILEDGDFNVDPDLKG